MAPSAEPYAGSHSALSALHRTLCKHNSNSIGHPLPERPRNLLAERDLFLDGAISTLSASTNYVLDSVLEIKDDVKDVKNRVDKLEKGFIRLEGEVNEVKREVNEVKREVNEVKREVNEVKREVNEVKKEVKEVKRETDRRFKGLEGRFANMAAQGPWDDIVPVEYNNQAGDHTVSDGFPSNYPDKVVKLWRLQTPRHRRALVSLLEFYDICGWESWGYEDRLVPDSDSELDDIGGKNPTLAAAVASYLMVALRALTQRLGVDYERMRRRITEELPTRLPLKDLVGLSKSVGPWSSPESGTKLEWKVGSSNSEHPVFRDTDYKAQSGDSTVPNTEDETEKATGGVGFAYFYNCRNTTSPNNAHYQEPQTQPLSPNAHQEKRATRAKRQEMEALDIGNTSNTIFLMVEGLLGFWG
ncbi:hypothetical protein K469DRAFT_687743 [Zopfia rhizophila CBS 207.26]|uniref:Uncharacterized protein n=1 Tax=Zopfia rhizophila CBS 207.26 TaxID=1314779 RepID=A0A6A6E7W1_9PEZI|nr:hypothetical protein K469DRAFT_687743 [Zopfia rhizophila CBS 207.26]